MIDISKADKAEVLMRLVNAADFSGADPRPAVIDIMKRLPKMTYAMAQRIIERNPDMDLDYVDGRSVKVNLKGSLVDEWKYDRDNGEGAARRALEGVAGVVFLEE